jgi:hypothetical protein
MVIQSKNYVPSAIGILERARSESSCRPVEKRQHTEGYKCVYEHSPHETDGAERRVKERAYEHR